MDATGETAPRAAWREQLRWIFTPVGGALVLYLLVVGVYLVTAGARFDNVDGALRVNVTRMLYERGDLYVDVDRTLPLIPQLAIWGDGALRYHLAKNGISPLALANNDFRGIRAHYRLFSRYRFRPTDVWGDDWRALHPDSTRRGRDGTVTVHYALGHSIAMVPLYSLGGERGAALTLAVLTPGVAVLVFLLLLHLGLSWRRAMGTALVVGLASVLWPYAVSTHDSALSALAVMGTIYFAVRQRSGHWTWSILVGLCAGFGVLVKHANVVTMAGVALIWFGQWRAHRQHGRTGWREMLLPVLITLATFAAMYRLDHWLFALRFAGAEHYDYFAGRKIVAEVGPLQAILNRLSTFELEGFLGFLISPSKSIFLFTPPLIIALVTLRRFYRRDRWLTLALLLVSALSYAGFSVLPYWSGDYSWGPRYLVPIMPLLLLPLCDLSWDRRWVRALVVAVVAASVLIQFSASAVDNDRYYAVRGLQRGWHYDKAGRRRVYFSLSYFRPLEVVAHNWELLGQTLAVLDRIDALPAGKKPTPRVLHSKAEWRELLDPYTGRLRRGVQPYLVLRSYYNLSDFWYVHGRYKQFASAGTLKTLLMLNMLLIVLAGTMVGAGFWACRRVS